MESKAENRKKILQMLKNFSDYEKRRQNKDVLKQLTASSKWKSAKKIALYMSMPIEFNLTELFDQSDDKEILIPKCLPERQMIFAKYDKENLVRSKFGLLEPKSEIAVEPDFILVPGLIWNDEGYESVLVVVIMTGIWLILRDQRPLYFMIFKKWILRQKAMTSQYKNFL